MRPTPFVWPVATGDAQYPSIRICQDFNDVTPLRPAAPSAQAFPKSRGRVGMANVKTTFVCAWCARGFHSAFEVRSPCMRPCLSRTPVPNFLCGVSSSKRSRAQPRVLCPTCDEVHKARASAATVPREIATALAPRQVRDRSGADPHSNSGFRACPRPFEPSPTTNCQ